MGTEKTQLEEFVEAQSRQTSSNSLFRALSIAKHYRWSQMARRAITGLKKVSNINKTIGPIEVPKVVSINELNQHAFREVSEIYVATANLERSYCHLVDQKIHLLGETLQLPKSKVWQEFPDQLSHLARFQLHYHEYLLNPHSEDPSSLVWQFVENWIDNHPSETTSRYHDSWHPYCISRRIPAWIHLLSSVPLSDSNKVCQSLHQQAEFLSNNLEHDLGGNHIFENIYALMLAGLFLDSPRSHRWLQIAKKQLRIELRDQLLDSGEHFELSPMYHCQVLGNLIQIAILAEQTEPEIAAVCKNNSATMLRFLKSILHPDGKIPLFGDSGFSEAPSMEQILRLNKRLGNSELESKTNTNQIRHYFLFRNPDKDDFLIFDAGPVAAKNLPAHGHCDLLNFELTISGTRWIVDSGNYNYQADSMRQYCRSSVAHNVVTLEGRNFADVWSKFRMGSRGKVVHVNSTVTEHIQSAACTHNSYKKLGLKSANRLIGMAGQDFFCFDHSTKKAVNLIGHLHLSPDINCKQVGNHQIEINDESGNKRLLCFSGVESIEFVTGWYCPRFGKRVLNTAIQYRRANDQLTMGWVLQAHSSKPTCASITQSQVHLANENVATNFNFETMQYLPIA